jgi:hypothetical protein
LLCFFLCFFFFTLSIDFYSLLKNKEIQYLAPPPPGAPPPPPAAAAANGAADATRCVWRCLSADLGVLKSMCLTGTVHRHW